MSVLHSRAAYIAANDYMTPSGDGYIWVNGSQSTHATATLDIHSIRAPTCARSAHMPRDAVGSSDGICRNRGRTGPAARRAPAHGTCTAPRRRPRSRHPRSTTGHSRRRTRPGSRTVTGRATGCATSRDRDSAHAHASCRGRQHTDTDSLDTCERPTGQGTRVASVRTCDVARSLHPATDAGGPGPGHRRQARIAARRQRRCRLHRRATVTPCDQRVTRACHRRSRRPGGKRFGQQFGVRRWRRLIRAGLPSVDRPCQPRPGIPDVHVRRARHAFTPRATAGHLPRLAHRRLATNPALPFACVHHATPYQPGERPDIRHGTPRVTPNHPLGWPAAQAHRPGDSATSQPRGIPATAIAPVTPPRADHPVRARVRRAQGSDQEVGNSLTFPSTIWNARRFAASSASERIA